MRLLLELRPAHPSRDVRRGAATLLRELLLALEQSATDPGRGKKLISSAQSGTFRCPDGEVDWNVKHDEDELVG